jgi:hypothetical protein
VPATGTTIENVVPPSESVVMLPVPMTVAPSPYSLGEHSGLRKNSSV